MAANLDPGEGAIYPEDFVIKLHAVVHKGLAGGRAQTTSGLCIRTLQDENAEDYGDRFG
jgi:hypothetical protein